MSTYPVIPRSVSYPQLEDIAAGAKRIYLRPEHLNTITDMVSIAEKELVVTCSLDRRVHVWQVRATPYRRDRAYAEFILLVRGTPGGIFSHQSLIF